MTEILRSIAMCGARGLPRRRVRQILAVNLLALAAVVMTLPYQVFYLVYDFGRFWPPFLCNIGFLASYAAVLEFNRRGLVALARGLVIATMYAQFLVVTAWISTGSGVHLFYIPVSGYLGLVFVASRIRILVLLNTLAFALFLVCHVAFEYGATPILLPEAVQPIMYAVSAAGTVMLAGSLLLFFHWDISRAEAALDRANRELEERRQEAERANLAKSRFLAAASHDIRQPLHALYLFTSTLSPASSEDQHIIGCMHESLDSARTMLDGLLEISRLDAGAVIADVRAVALQTMFDRLRAALTVAAVASGATLEIRPTHAQVLSDEGLLERMLSNLIGNALQYARGGYVFVVARRRRGEWRIEVRDNGPGIPPEMHEAIFEEFQRGSVAAERAVPGFGLGLSIVRRISGLLQHPVELRSAPGRGTTVAVRVEAARTTGVTRKESVSARLDDARILVIDRNRDTRRATARIFADAGAVVTAEPDIEKSRHLSWGGQPADIVVINDDSRSVEAGLQGAGEIAADIGPAARIVLVTGAIDTDDMLRAASSEVTVLHKPVGPDVLVHTVGRLLSRLQEPER